MFSVLLNGERLIKEKEYIIDTAVKNDFQSSVIEGLMKKEAKLQKVRPLASPARSMEMNRMGVTRSAASLKLKRIMKALNTDMMHVGYTKSTPG